ncbi:MAG TPA: hypothetical protein VIK07_12825, partial [Bacteroidales bacterium]
MHKKVIIALLVAFTACNYSAKGQKSLQTNLKWSIKMANTVMTTSDSLIHYVSGTPKWAYDIAFLGKAIDGLGSVNP